jgi:hypothetical protein
MSLNKITQSSDYLQKQYLNVGCNDIKCTSLEVGTVPVVPANLPVIGKYPGNFTVDVPGSVEQPGVVYYEKVGNPNTQAGGVAFTNDSLNTANLWNNGTGATGTTLIVLCRGNTLIAGNAFFSGVFTIEL